ncbi:hypothetical protein CDAR_205031 [Caerostris darwini]|uniref:Uncharacterized protein n=1 Tax=Caerostris darwini TaxID=1538125 RepID=A0AAV4NC32_9ARAC|nr:hypothetical protein CDAR_205031 [Caerostris darwini]
MATDVLPQNAVFNGSYVTKLAGPFSAREGEVNFSMAPFWAPVFIATFIENEMEENGAVFSALLRILNLDSDLIRTSSLRCL